MDHLAPPLALDQDMWEGMSIASWVLARHERADGRPSRVVRRLAAPAVLARQATSLDHVSGGRFELGLGWGSVPAELETFGVGVPSASERVGLIGRVARDTARTVDRRDARPRRRALPTHRAQQRPVPTRPIPITIGGRRQADARGRREYADWWNVPVHELQRLDALRADAGTDTRSVKLMVALCAVRSRGPGSDRADASPLRRQRARRQPGHWYRRGSGRARRAVAKPRVERVVRLVRRLLRRWRRCTDSPM